MSALNALNALQRDLAATLPGPLPRGAIGRFHGDLAEFGYPEIAGYWLGWAAAHPAVQTSAGEAVLAWLAPLQESAGTWPTRPGSEDGEHLHTRYFFDHAMLWHGLGHWARQRPGTQAQALQARVGQALAGFVDDHGLHGVRGPAPPRWSGQAGPFLLKALARTREATAIQPLAAQCIARLGDQALHAAHAQAHPQLYAIEGLWLLGEHARAEQALHALLAAHGGVGQLRESPGAGPRRHDVIAQALRAALLLGWPVHGQRAWGQAHDHLVASIPGNGRLPFAPGHTQAPSWTAMFTEQALRAWQGETITAEELA